MPVYHNGFFGMRVETTIGSEAAVDGGDAALVYDLELDTLEDAENNERTTPVFPSQGVQTDTPGLAAGGCTFKMRMGGSGQTGPTQIPPWAHVFVACGWSLTVDSSPITTHTFNLQSEGAGGEYPILENPLDVSGTQLGQTWTVRKEDHVTGTATRLARVLLGATGNTVLKLIPGSAIEAEVTMKGAYLESQLETALVPTFPTSTAEPRVVGANVTWTPSGGSAHTPILREFTIDPGRALARRDDGNASSGVIAYDSPSRVPIWSATIEQPTSLTAPTGQNWENVWSQGTSGAWSIGPVGSTTGNIIDIDIPNAGVSKVTRRNEEGRILLELEGKCAVNTEATGNDEITIVVT